MGKNSLSQTGYDTRTNEFLFSLNIALLVRLVNARTSFSNLESRLQWRINRTFGLNLHSYVGAYAAFFVLAIVLAVCIFAFLRLCSASLLGAKVLRSVAGIISVAALPICWLYLTRLYSPPVLPNPPHVMLLMELGGAIVCTALYLLVKWPLPVWSSVLLLILHFGFWGWLFVGGPYFWRAPEQLVFPVVSLCACIAWATYMAQQRSTVTTSAGSDRE